MKFIFSLFIFFALPCSAFAAEQITSFTSDIYLHTDGTFDVTETIVYNFGPEYRHGIYRFIDKKHPQESSSFLKKRYIDIVLQSVTMDGLPVDYDTTDSSENLEAKIGSADGTINGEHTYEIKYKVRGGYSYFDDDTAEIYWNVTGNQWEVPIQQVVAEIHPGDVKLVAANACYSGRPGENIPCALVDTLDDGTIVFKSEALFAGSGVTVAREIDASTIGKTIFEKYNIWFIFLIICPVLFVGIVVFGYTYRTKYKIGGPIIVQYEPYKNFKPMYSGMLIDGRLDPRDITAGIVYLAQKGFIKIAKIDKKILFLFEVDDYQITYLRSSTDIENTFLRDVLSLIFSPIPSTIGQSVTLSDLKKNTTQQKENALTIEALKKALKKDMEDAGLIQINTFSKKFIVLFTITIFLLSIFGDLLVSLFSWSVPLLVVIVAVCMCSLLVLGIMYERKTRAGYEAVNYLKGFKLFLSVTDKERFTFHNAPQKSPEQFMEYLPYAIAFGVEKQWAKAFEDITIPNPGWYDGNSVGTFSAVNLTTSLGAFSSSLTTSATASASSSGGSSGGGFSGGGGGGGGGGSW